MSYFENFRKVVEKLRDPQGGCPWDLEQTHKTLKPYAIEETYEVLEAIDSEDDQQLLEELGDLLLQVVLHSQIASERNAFNIEDVCNQVTEKMIRRHPHVFGEAKLSTSNEVLQNWEKIKKTENNKNKKLLDGLPLSMPSLLVSQRIGEKTSKVGFDWQDSKSVLNKIKEELNELEIEIIKNDSQKAKEELGDLLFATAQLARWLEFSAEESLKHANRKFVSRFTKLESMCSNLAELSFEELDSLWNKVKEQESEQ